MDNKIFFHSVGKFYDIIETRSRAETLFDWVESARFHMWRMVLSKGALIWVCRRLREASAIRGRIFKTWRCNDYFTSIFLSLKFNQYGRCISLISIESKERAVIMLENTFNEGWERLAEKMNIFINRVTSYSGVKKYKEETNLSADKGKGREGKE